MLSESQVKYLWRQMTAKGIRRKEPLDDQIPHVRPSILNAALEMLVTHRVQSKSDIEQAISLNPADIESLGGAAATWLSADKVVAFNPHPTLKSRHTA